MGELYRQNTVKAGSQKTFDEFFQTNSFNNKKGVVKINLGTLP